MNWKVQIKLLCLTLFNYSRMSLVFLVMCLIKNWKVRGILVEKSYNPGLYESWNSVILAYKVRNNEIKQLKII